MVFRSPVSKREPCTIVPVQTSYITLSGHSMCLPCELDCQFEVSPARWRFGEIDISDLTSAGAGHFEMTSNGSLCINDASPSDSGSYYCLVGSDVLKHTVTVIGIIYVNINTYFELLLHQEFTNTVLLLWLSSELTMQLIPFHTL